MMEAVTTITARKRILDFFVALAIGLSASAFLVVVFVWGWGYYGMPRLERPFHPYHNFLRPSSLAGLLFGIIAAGLFVLNLGYLIRKRFINLRYVGSLRTWMDFHVVTGLVGGGVVAFHAAFAPCSALGILALVALSITLLTGIVGRYIYVHIPRSLEGRELELGQVREQLDSCREQLEQAGVNARWLHEGETPEIRHQRVGLARSFASLIIGGRQRRRDYRQLRRAVLSSSELKPMARQILPVARNFCRHWQWMVRYHEWRDLLASWRFLHRWLAIVMLIVASFHIFLAFRYADLSVLGGLR
ncbi:MAG: hypothetical protein JSW27_08585 [Phycisphaerales bacterium]|nr:MAG: hypothetical protein JSW27_08585 [Phycisphaerales bacterium]